MFCTTPISFFPTEIKDIIRDYSQSPFQWVAETMQQKNSSERIARYCISLLRQNIPNDVPNALTQLTPEQQDTLLGAWKKSQEISHQFLYLYFLSLDKWSEKETKFFKKIDLFKENLPAHLIAVLKLKNALIEKGELTDDFMNDIRARYPSILHLQFSGIRLDTKVINPNFPLNGINFSHANITFSCLKNTALTQANFEFASIRYSSFNQAKLIQANVKNAKIKSGDFKETNLTNADFTETEIDDTTNFSGAELTGCNFCHTKKLPIALLNIIKSFVIKFKKDVRFNPLLDFLKEPFSSDYFGIYIQPSQKRIPIEHYVNTLWLLGAESQQDLRERINKIPASHWTLRHGEQIKTLLAIVVDNFSLQQSQKFSLK